MIVPSPSTKRSLQEAASRYHEALLGDDEALSYLIDHRKITKEALQSFSLGVVREPVSGHEYMRNRLSFPYITRTGIVSIRFRYLGDPKAAGAQKFLSSTGDVPRIYNVNVLADNDKIYVCEGETDTIMCWMAGIPAIGIPGANAFRTEFARVLRHRAVVVLADNDDDGQGKKFSDEIFTSINGCDTVMMPRGHDVSSFTAEHGIDALREKVGYEQ